ncbi:hypothetical protein TPHA_0F03110 [Tetrapisispora phaffii CBS 4417]|uniref:Uncharacterized protein n=1 Tax=Tetrapisispora phaffii (strain ATCC 24235 / CBS 4417 / NBRC 1672 / NRRL Y-8282 / UCD 70-5) TaxID=1071381 RepID=G8BUK6_TETPH|nr:hypothetical protein TPHA_0F03110 [Tetrapisispora phaffii CBS 4417]CCE63792.1 hypothetical protein TPHA_0F03110 [Tetrapisispora phaffii CBS 4417]
MYSPNFKADSPIMSPMAFHVKDPANKNNIQNLLLSPTKLSLDNTKGSSIYRTSLSKLNESTRTGRSRQRRGSDIMRSGSPIQFPSIGSAAPKMLKPEYLNTQNSAIPLLSTIMKQSSKTMDTQKTDQDNTQNNQNSQRENVETRKLNTSIFAQLQESFINFNRQKEKVENIPVTTSKETHTEKEILTISKISKEEKHKPQSTMKNNALRKISHTESTLSGSTMHEQDGISEIESLEANNCNVEKLPAVHPAKIVQKRIVSEHATIQESELHEVPKDINVDALPTDRNGFVQLNNHKNNRYSFISSASTDFELDWYNQLQQQSNLQLSQPSQRFPSQSESDDSARNEFRIKKLEIEINELKLQNEKLIQTFISENEKMRQLSTSQIQSIPATSRVKYSEKDTRHMRNKVKRLERKLANYKKAMNKLVDNNFPSAHMKYISTDQDEVSSVKTRISRISDKDLKQIEEAKSSSDQSTSELNDEEDDFSDSIGSLTDIKELVDMTYTSERDFLTEEITEEIQRFSTPQLPSKRNSIIGNKKKVGFQLNLQIEKK